MPSLDRGNGVRVTFPETMTVSDADGAGERRGGLGSFAPPMEEGPLASELLSSLETLGLRRIADVPVHTLAEPSDPVRRRRRGAPAIPPVQEVTLTAELPPGERAVALVEQDGLYSWTFGDVETLPDDGRTPRRRGASAPGPGTSVRFTVPLHASSAPGRRTRLLGMEHVFRPIRAFVFAFPARLVVGQVVKHLERDIDTGLLLLVRPEADGWQPLADPASLDLPADRPPRVLLFVHGTFSSVAGGYGALGMTDFGSAFLTDALARYDAVLGFDHRTLGVDPLENAEELLAELVRLPAGGIVFDAIGHSRGGLVLRSLIEHVLPVSGLDTRFERAVFVGSTNGGTALADRENWHRLIDLYTNIAIGSMKALSLAAPQAVPVTSALTGMLRGVAAFVKALATAVIEEEQVPGLAAMNPRGRFVADLNRTQPGQPTPATIDLFAVTSDFEPALADEGTLPAKLLRALADGAVDRLMGERNDLVVDVDSMTEVDPHVSGFVDDVLAYPANGLVHHTNYFHHEATVKSLARWLQLDSPVTAEDGGGGAVETRLPPYVDDDMVVVPADATGRAVGEILRASPSDWVVIRRHEPASGEAYHYAYRPDELTSVLEEDGEIASLLGLGESTTSSEAPVQLVTGFDSSEPVEGRPQAARTVAISGGDPVGVVPGLREMRSVTPPAARQPLPSPVARTHRPTFTPLGSGRTRRTPAGRRMRAVRSAVPGAEPPAASPKPARGRHSFRAEMPHEVVVDSDATVELTVSRETLTVAAGRAGEAGTADVELDRSMIVDVRPRRGFDLIGDGRAELRPLQEDEPERALFFDVRATDVGAGEIDVVVRQGQVPLVTLRLMPAVVAEPTRSPRRLASAEIPVEDVPPLAEPIHELTIWEQERGGETRLRFVFESPELNIRDSAWSETITGGIAGYVSGVYADIEERWLRRSHSPATFTRDLQAIGMAMFEELVPLEIRQVLWEHRDRIANIQVISEEPHVPWEIVHLKDPAGRDRSGRFLGELGVVRWLENLPRNGFGPDHIDIGTALAVIPEYPEDSDWELVEPAREFTYLEKALGAVKLPSRRDEVDPVLETPGSFDLLHYAGHGEAPAEGTFDASLILGVRASGGRWVTEALDSETVRQFAQLSDGDRRPMVVLNACQVGRMRRRLGGTGGFARAFLEAGAGMFVSSLWAVGDEPARTFVETLYGALLEGDTVSEATISARQAARDAGDLTWLAYTVYAHPHARVTVRSPGG